ncbi:unnamed protein product [Bursaphelenchus okinawaensis]|uniref:Uncharacterized protein n=1 Tax=Bursaphelenchus okinawaensis TaxID=465554 RepID=A0A811KKL5_9BILA|nr:unnamed protein product [Bursaphelenchus okinawaensis]CAG9105180.1 unnamed protein product [Bursaphelenchus okinawaensis]
MVRTPAIGTSTPTRSSRRLRKEEPEIGLQEAIEVIEKSPSRSKTKRKLKFDDELDVTPIATNSKVSKVALSRQLFEQEDQTDEGKQSKEDVIDDRLGSKTVNVEVDDRTLKDNLNPEYNEKASDVFKASEVADESIMDSEVNDREDEVTVESEHDGDNTNMGSDVIDYGGEVTAFSEQNYVEKQLTMETGIRDYEKTARSDQNVDEIPEASEVSVTDESNTNSGMKNDQNETPSLFTKRIIPTVMLTPDSSTVGNETYVKGAPEQNNLTYTVRGPDAGDSTGDDKGDDSSDESSTYGDSSAGERIIDLKEFLAKPINMPLGMDLDLLSEDENEDSTTRLTEKNGDDTQANASVTSVIVSFCEDSDESDDEDDDEGLEEEVSNEQICADIDTSNKENSRPRVLEFEQIEVEEHKEALEDIMVMSTEGNITEISSEDVESKNALVVDDEVKRQIEAIVKKRIAEKTFDDPKRVRKPRNKKDNVFDGVLRTPLMKLIEEEYKKKASEVNEKKQQLDSEAKQLKDKMLGVFNQVDCFSDKIRHQQDKYGAKMDEDTNMGPFEQADLKIGKENVNFSLDDLKTRFTQNMNVKDGDNVDHGEKQHVRFSRVEGLEKTVGVSGESDKTEKPKLKKSLVDKLREKRWKNKKLGRVIKQKIMKSKQRLMKKKLKDL